MHGIIRFGEVTVTVRKDGSETGGQFCMYEVDVHPRTKRAFGHRHYSFDQTVVGMNGLVVWAVGGEQVVIGPGERLFIPRGTAHGFLNRQSYPARFLCIYSPAVITSHFFEALQSVEQGEEGEQVARIDALLEQFDSKLTGPPEKT